MAIARCEVTGLHERLREDETSLERRRSPRITATPRVRHADVRVENRNRRMTCRGPWNGFLQYPIIIYWREWCVRGSRQVVTKSVVTALTATSCRQRPPS